MKKYGKIKLVICLMILTIAIINLFLPINSPNENVAAKYKCNYKAISLKTQIDVVDEDGNESKICGEKIFFSSISDPLTMYDADGNVICFADDSYDFITQNDHVIMKDDKVLYAMEGKFNFFGDNYIIYDSEGAEIAKAKFNFLNTKGTLEMIDGTVVARYNSRWCRRDYVVTIFEGNTIDVDAVQMLFASYASDSVADSSN